ncbi:hypothetical protein C8R41DRAFT_920216 [Lentinula lateritia]|uniref:Uncharacterized protein n=1 Tax=Lentinula lateritia TaxID=40482 RepID=A0ABQ8VFG5_9AGAR|nr:hypothetical protein C8R41DRAFT_920216 [Lentinula lateritia]
MKERKAAAAAKKRAEEEAAKKAAEEVHRQKEIAAWDLEEWRRKMAEAATTCSRWGSSPGETSVSPRRPVVEIRKEKGKGKAKAQPVGGDPNDGNNGEDDDNDEEQAPCEQCQLKKIPCLEQAIIHNVGHTYLLAAGGCLPSLVAIFSPFVTITHGLAYHPINLQPHTPADYHLLFSAHDHQYL